MATVDINYLAVLVSAVIAMGIGALWYSVLFGKKWMELMNLDGSSMKDMKKKATKGYIINFIALLVMAYVLAHFVDYSGATTFVEGILLGFWVWLGFVATILLGSVLWENKPFNLYLINAGHYLAIMMVMGAIMAVWN